ncbi:TBC1 domain family member 23 isoform X3 [Strongylocentrotus purpuratus]|uniref:TBC1 domain family member 23 n=1 Tax=Strongylocentrotus purpuratus TaxID=7668 RepID=A0A7M7NFC5_STRPU|nr:TBC1 domain family member 23 isoform X3 [Strongylocentrotus purpuratus]
MAALESDDTSWHAELEEALVESCDFGTLRNICKGRQIPNIYRASAWKICLNVAGKANALTSFDGIFDLPEQDILRKDCREFIDKLDNSEEEKLSLVSDLESVLTFYCKSKNLKYEVGNGWLDILGPLVALHMDKALLYNCFYAIMTKYVPRETNELSRTYHLFRLLVMYHEPELCNFLETRKIFPDSYTKHWFNTVFAGRCGLEIIQPMWSLYFLQADPFLQFFLGLVILVNAKEHIMGMTESSRDELIDCLAMFPSQLEEDDVEDFFSLAQYYASKTPQSFRREYQSLFGANFASPKEASEGPSALCLLVNPSELLQAVTQGPGDGISYFVVDCRPADQYNRSHLATAFHLDANLMLQQPAEFASTVKALLSAQQQSITAGSQAAGEHLCFMGTGREEEDQYLHMIIANFLQRKIQSVSMAAGGYTALLKLVEKELTSGMIDPAILKSVIITQPESASSDDSGADSSSPENSSKLTERGAAVMGRLTTIFKSKSASVKDKVIEFIKNDPAGDEKHVSSLDTGKRYRSGNVQSVFSIGDEDDDNESVGGAGSSDEERRELVSTDTWLKKPDILKSFDCQEVKDSGQTYPGHVLVTPTHLYILREATNRKGFSYIMARRSLADVVRITSKKRCSEFITFRYGRVNAAGETLVYGIDRIYIPEASEATKMIKQLIVKCIDEKDPPQEPAKDSPKSTDNSDKESEHAKGDAENITIPKAEEESTTDAQSESKEEGVEDDGLDEKEEGKGGEDEGKVEERTDDVKEES